MNRANLGRFTLVVGLALVLAGCGAHTTLPAPAASPSPSAPTSSPFPPRPATLSLVGLNPCALLTPAQQAQLGVQEVGREDDTDELGSLACQWDNNGAKPATGLVAKLVTKRGAEYALGSTTGVQIVQVGGFGAVQTSSPYINPQRHCILLVDVAPGQSLWAQFDNLARDYPGINHDVACQLDRRAAELMLGNLRALAR